MSTEHEKAPITAGLSTTRIETLVDGVFAVALTLLILDIHVPQVEPGNLLAALYDQRMKVLAYALTFLILGVLWVGHHNQFYYIKRADRTMLWINILYLMCVAFVPFSADLLGTYHQEKEALVVYGVNLIVCGLVLYLHWAYAVGRGRLVEGDIDPHLVAIVKRRILTPPVAYVLAIAMAFVNTWLSIAIYVITPLTYVFPTHIDMHFNPFRNPHKDDHGAGEPHQAESLN